MNDPLYWETSEPGPFYSDVNRPTLEAGLLMLEAGGDFADGVIAYEGKWLGGETFVSFDKQAVALLTAQGQSAWLL